MADFEVNKENMIEFISGEHFCTVSFTNNIPFLISSSFLHELDTKSELKHIM